MHKRRKARKKFGTRKTNLKMLLRRYLTWRKGQETDDMIVVTDLLGESLSEVHHQFDGLETK